MINENEMPPKMDYCTVCGRTEMQLDALGIPFALTGRNGSHICMECANEIYSVIRHAVDEESGKTPNSLPIGTEDIESENNDDVQILKPKEIKEFIDNYVIGQDRAKERLAVAVYNHYKRINAETDDVEIQKSNILLCGPTGTGKTYMAQTIARLLNVPFTIVDATVFTEAGYVGEDIESILTRLLQEADYDVSKAEQGIVFIDEIDKLARKSGNNPSISKEVGNEGVQQGMLKLLEGSTVLVPPQGGRKHPEMPMIPVRTNNILFICGGAFDGLDKKIAQRYNVGKIGFNTGVSDDGKTFNKDENPLKYVTSADLKGFGLIPELLGRLPIITYTDDLDKESLIKILTEPKNALVKQYIKLFELDNMKLTFDDEVYEYVVDKAIESKLGARGLRGIMENLMQSLMYDAPSKNETEYRITLDYAKSVLES